jgi:hypothetical protein
MAGGGSAWQGKPGRDRHRGTPGGAWQAVAGQDVAGILAGQGWTGQGNAGQGRQRGVARLARAGPAKARGGMVGQGMAGTEAW